MTSILPALNHETVNNNEGRRTPSPQRMFLEQNQPINNRLKMFICLSSALYTCIFFLLIIAMSTKDWIISESITDIFGTITLRYGLLYSSANIKGQSIETSNIDLCAAYKHLNGASIHLCSAGITLFVFICLIVFCLFLYIWISLQHMCCLYRDRCLSEIITIFQKWVIPFVIMFYLVGGSTYLSLILTDTDGKLLLYKNYSFGYSFYFFWTCAGLTILNYIVYLFL